jgi:Flp pilus assembly pilin Flp
MQQHTVSLLGLVTLALIALFVFMSFGGEWSWRQNTAALEMAQPGDQ